VRVWRVCVCVFRVCVVCVVCVGGVSCVRGWGGCVCVCVCVWVFVCGCTYVGVFVLVHENVIRYGGIICNAVCTYGCCVRTRRRRRCVVCDHAKVAKMLF